MQQKDVFAGLFRRDPHDPWIRVALALLMNDEDIIMLPLTCLEVEGEKTPDGVAFAYTRADLLDPDFVPACCNIGIVDEFASVFVTGCNHGWMQRLAEILEP